MSAGPCACWLGRWWSWGWRPPCPTRESAKHGSWLNMAEIEFSVFSNQCLNRRIEDEVSLKREIAALETERNQAGATIDWRSNGGSLPPTPGTSFRISIHRFHTDPVLAPLE